MSLNAKNQHLKNMVITEWFHRQAQKLPLTFTEWPYCGSLKEMLKVVPCPIALVTSTSAL